MPVPLMLGPDFLRKPKTARAVWQSLLAFCALRENGGVIADAKSWSNKDWDRLAGTTIRELEGVVEAQLAWWEGVDLHVAHYPIHPEEQRRKRRDAGRTGGERSGEVRKSRGSGSSTPSADASPPPSNVGEGRGEVGKVEEGVEDRARASQEGKDLASYLADAIRSHSPDARVNPDRWAEDIDLAIRRDKRPLAELRRAIDWAHRSPDDFWRPNIRSGAKLREHFDMLIGQANKAGFQTLAVLRRPPPNGKNGQMTDAEFRALERNARELGLVDDEGKPT